MINSLQEELKKAMKRQDKNTILGLRNMIGKLKARQIDKGIALTSTSEFFDDLAKGNGPKNSILAQGYAGWGPGQIENEIISKPKKQSSSNFKEL